MINGRDGEDGDSKQSVEDAVGWYLKDESGRVLDAEAQLRWQIRLGEPRNRKEHLGLVRMIRQMRRMPPPDLPSRVEVIADLQDEQDVEGPE